MTSVVRMAAKRAQKSPVPTDLRHGRSSKSGKGWKAAIVLTETTRGRRVERTAAPLFIGLYEQVFVEHPTSGGLLAKSLRLVLGSQRRR